MTLQLSEEQINEIAARNAFAYVYDNEVLISINNVYHHYDTDGLNSSSYYDLYVKVLGSWQADLYYIEDGDVSNCDFSNLGIHEPICVVEEFEDYPITSLENFFYAAKDVVDATISTLCE